MHHQHYKEFCYLWSLSSLYDVFPNFQPPVSIHLRNFDLFLLYLEILRLNLRNFLKADASPQTTSQGPLPGASPKSRLHWLRAWGGENRITCPAWTGISKNTCIILSYIAHTTLTKMLKMIWFSDLVISLLFSTHRFYICTITWHFPKAYVVSFLSPSPSFVNRVWWRFIE